MSQITVEDEVVEAGIIEEETIIGDTITGEEEIIGEMAGLMQEVFIFMVISFSIKRNIFYYIKIFKVVEAEVQLYLQTFKKMFLLLYRKDKIKLLIHILL